MATADAEEQRFIDALSHARSHVVGMLRRLGASATDLDDLVQEVLGRAWQYRTSFDAGRSLNPWLSGISVRVWVDHRTAGARLPDRLGPEDPHAPDRTTADPDARDQIVHALEKLTPIQREVLLAFHRDGVSLAEIARRTHMSLNTVKSHLHRARRALGGGPPS